MLVSCTNYVFLIAPVIPSLWPAKPCGSKGFSVSGPRKPGPLIDEPQDLSNTLRRPSKFICQVGYGNPNLSATFMASVSSIGTSPG